MQVRKVVLPIAAAALIGVFVVPGGSTDEVGGADISSGSQHLNLVAYAVAKQGFDAIIPAYREHADTGFAQSYGASGDQSRKVERRVPADIVNLSVEPDVTRLVRAGVVEESWQDNIPGDESGKAVPFGSVVTFVTREGNPLNIQTWDDLLNVEVISPNPASSGSAKWNLLAPYAAWLYAKQEQGGSLQEAHEYASEKLTQLISNSFRLRPKSGREATSTFEQGQGDVLLSYENEAILLANSGASISYLNPAQTFRIENPVAVVGIGEEKNPEAINFRDYLFTPEAEQVWQQQGFRPGPALFHDVTLPAPFAPFDVAYSIDDLSRSFQQLAEENPALAQQYNLDGKSGWAIVDALLFQRAESGGGATDGVITKIYREAL